MSQAVVIGLFTLDHVAMRIAALNSNDVLPMCSSAAVDVGIHSYSFNKKFDNRKPYSNNKARKI